MLLLLLANTEHLLAPYMLHDGIFQVFGVSKFRTAPFWRGVVEEYPFLWNALLVFGGEHDMAKIVIDRFRDWLVTFFV